VLRGEEWLSSLPKHLLLFQYFGWKEPRYAHVPLLLNKDKTKLSKRQNDVDVNHYIQKGYLSKVMVNFLALLGWNPGTTQEIFTLDELIESFSLDRVQKAGAVFDTEKLDWLQGQWIRKMDKEELTQRVIAALPEPIKSSIHIPEVTAQASLIQDRITFFSEVPEMLSFFYEEPQVTVDLLANKKQKITQKQLPMILDALIRTLTEVNAKQWNENNLKEKLFALAEEKKLKSGQLLWPLRAALTGLPYSPGAFEVAVALGKEKTLKRLETAKRCS